MSALQIPFSSKETWPWADDSGGRRSTGGSPRRRHHDRVDPQEPKRLCQARSRDRSGSSTIFRFRWAAHLQDDQLARRVQDEKVPRVGQAQVDIFTRDIHWQRDLSVPVSNKTLPLSSKTAILNRIHFWQLRITALSEANKRCGGSAYRSNTSQESIARGYWRTACKVYCGIEKTLWRTQSHTRWREHQLDYLTEGLK